MGLIKQTALVGLFLLGTRVDAFMALRTAPNAAKHPRLALRAMQHPEEHDYFSQEPVLPPSVELTSADHTSSLVAFGLLATVITVAPGDVWAADASLPVLLGRFVLDPALNIGQFLMLIRVIMSWYPEVRANKMPWLLATFPTEGILRATRSVIPPAFGVDISPVIWIAVLSFFREILFGQQGLFNIGAFD